jgi:hypothetical protein
VKNNYFGRKLFFMLFQYLIQVFDTMREKILKEKKRLKEPFFRRKDLSLF